MLDIDTLRPYVAMADLGGLAPAGQRIGRTEAAISQQMKRLELRTGQALFRRTGRRGSCPRSGRARRRRQPTQSTAVFGGRHGQRRRTRRRTLGRFELHRHAHLQYVAAADR